MNTAAVLVGLINLLAIGALPLKVFRRDGRLNRNWWLTAGPFFVMGVLLAAIGAGLPTAPAHAAASTAALVLHAASIAVIAATAASHRHKPALWHQEDDVPLELVTWGPYRVVRHPFYGSFVMCLGAAALQAPHPVVILVALYGVVVLDATARREESRIADSRHGALYREYMLRTGRLIPFLGRAR